MSGKATRDMATEMAEDMAQGMSGRPLTAARRVTDTLIIAIILLLFWQGLHQIVGDTALPGPGPTLAYLVKFVPTARFVESAWATLEAFLYALVLSYALGLTFGVWMGLHRLSGAVGEPILISLYTLPKLTLYPVVLLIFGLSTSGRVTFGAMHGVLPVALLTMNAIRNIPPVYLKAARTMHLSKWQLMTTVLLPATLPEVVTGLRIGFTLTLLGVLLAEMFAAKAGLGFLIINAMQLLQAQEMVSVAVVLFVFAAVANALLLWMEHKLHRRT
jgi:NitT/TauT family transport system permease protein